MKLRAPHAVVLAASLLIPVSVGRALRAERVEPAAPPAPTLSPDRAWLGAETCQASAPRELGRSSVRNLRLHVASQPAGPRQGASYAHHGSTLAAWSSGEHAFTTRAIGTELGPAHEVTLDQGMNVSLLAPASDGRFLAIAIGALCEAPTRGHACLRATGLAADGTALGTPYAPEPSSQMLEITSTASLRGPSGAPTGVAVAMVSRWGGADIDLFRLDSAGQVQVEPHPIRSEGAGETPLQAIFAEGEQVVAVGSVDDGEHARPFVLALGQRRQAMAPAVPQSSPFRYARVQGAEIDLFYGLPRGRVRWLRVSTTDGSYVGGTPTNLDTTAALPVAPIFPTLVVTRGALSLTRTDLRGARVGTPVTLGPARGRVVSAWSWEGESLHAVWGVRSGREWIVSESHVACPAM